MQLLEDCGLDTPQVAQWLEQEGVEYIDDLAHCFRSAKHVMEECPFMLEAWLKAASRKTDAWRRTTDYAQAMRALQGASTAISSACSATPGNGLQRKGPAKAVRPKAGAPINAVSKDAAARTRAAKEAVRLSLSWAPRAGLARGLEKDDPLLSIVEQVQVERLAKFEAKGVWLALKEWGAWQAF